MNAVKKAIFGVMAGAVIVATVAGSSVFGTHVPVRQPAEPAGNPFIIEQSETSGVSLSAEVQPTAANATAIGTQRVTATVEPASAIYDLEWSLSVGSSLIPEDSISDYLAITPVSNNSIDLVCYQRFDGYATLQVEDGYTGKTASADVCAWTFDDAAKIDHYETFFSENDTGETSWDYHFLLDAGEPVMTECFDGWYLRPGIMGTTTNPQYPTDDRIADGTYGATDIVGQGVQLTYRPTNASGSTDYFVRYMPRGGFGIFSTPVYAAGDEVWLRVYITSTSARMPYLYGAGTDYTVLGQWYRDGVYTCKFVVNEGADVEGAMFGIGFTHDASLPITYTFTLMQLELFKVWD